MQMTEETICREYRQAKNRPAQIQILAELNGCSDIDITIILNESGEDVAVGKRQLNKLGVELDRVDEQIKVYEKRYMRIAGVINAAGKRTTKLVGHRIYRKRKEKAGKKKEGAKKQHPGELGRLRH